MTDAALLPLATIILGLAFLAPLDAFRLHKVAKAGLRAVLLGILTVIVLRLFGSPLKPQFHTDSALQELWEQLVVAGWWALAARSAAALARVVVVLEHRSREAQIVTDLVAGAVYLAAGVAIVTFVFALPLGGVLATSGILAIVFGLALQSTLSDVFSGIAVGIERPFKAGDLVAVDGGVEGRVLQVNWRSTHIATGPDHITVIPNSVIAKARVVNHSRPTIVRMDKVEIRLDPAASSHRCLAALTSAVRACQIPLEEPRPVVVQKSLEGDGATYEVYFAVADSDLLPAVKTELFSEIQRHLRHDGISLAVRGLAQVAPTPVPSVSELLERSDLFSSVGDNGRDALTEHLVEVRIKSGERLMLQDGQPDALLVIASGTVEVTRNESHGHKMIHRAGPGATLGAIGLITGLPYSASAVALTPVKAYRLDKAGVAASTAARPELSAELEAMAKRGQAALAPDSAASQEQTVEHTEMLLSRMRHFIRRVASDAAE